MLRSKICCRIDHAPIMRAIRVVTSTYLVGSGGMLFCDVISVTCDLDGSKKNLKYLPLESRGMAGWRLDSRVMVGADGRSEKKAKSRAGATPATLAAQLGQHPPFRKGMSGNQPRDSGRPQSLSKARRGRRLVMSNSTHLRIFT